MKHLKRTVAAIITMIMVMGLFAGIALAEPFHADSRLYADVMAADYTGKVIVLHSNDVHGSLDGYAYMKSLADAFKGKGADVIVADGGDFIQGNVYVSTTQGKAATTLMNAAGYNIATLGNHEFDYGTDVLAQRLSELNAVTVTANVFNETDKTLIADEATEIITAGGINIRFIGVDTPGLLSTCAPKMVQNVGVVGGADMVSLISECAKAEGADINILIGHLGIDDASGDNRSIVVWKALDGAVDFIIDGHSHSVFSFGEDSSQKIQQTGTGFANIGVIVIDETSKAITDNFLMPLKDSAGAYLWEPDAGVKATCDAIKAEVNQELSQKIAESLVDLNGDKGDVSTNGNRNSETNQGDFITDAFKWYAEEHDLLPSDISKDNLVALINGGAIRAWINKGDVTTKDIINSYPFNNTLCMIYVKGETLIRVLEACTAYIPSPVGGYPQISGMEINVDTSIALDTAENYPGTSFGKPKTVKRVTIKSVNGKDFDPSATYAIATIDFVASGGDTFFELKENGTIKDTGIIVPQVFLEYTQKKLGGVIGMNYEKPQGRIVYGKYVPKTADENSSTTTLLLIIAMAAAAGTCVVCVRKYKNN